jgi:hypothetical protein
MHYLFTAPQEEGDWEPPLFSFFDLFSFDLFSGPPATHARERDPLKISSDLTRISSKGLQATKLASRHFVAKKLNCVN